MTLDDKFYEEDDIPHVIKGKFAIIPQKEYSLPDGDEDYVKKCSLLRRDLTKLYGNTKTSIGFEGPIGISKTTLAYNTQFWNNMAVIAEDTESPGLFLLYQNIPVYAGPFQFDVGIDRKMMKISANASTKSIGFDRTIPGDRIFQEMYCGSSLSPDLYERLGKFLNEIIHESGHLDIICYLKASKDTILKRVQNRNRQMEMTGKKIILTDSQMENLRKKKEQFLGFMRQYASPSEFEEYKKKQVGLEIGREIIFQGAPPEYIGNLKDISDRRIDDILESFGFNGVKIEMDVEPKNDLDARDSKKAMYPLMLALKDATILSLLRRGHSISEKPNNKGMKIIPPRDIFY